MKHWPRPRSWSLPRRANPWLLVHAVAIIAVMAGGQALSGPVPRYAARRVYRERPGPRLMIVALPGLNWRDFRRPDAPNLQRLASRSAVGLMPAPSPSDTDPNRAWVSLGAGNPAIGARQVGQGRMLPGGRFRVPIAEVVAANQRALTHAEPGFLGSRLREFGLSTAIVEVTLPRDGATPGAAVLMDAAGEVDEAMLLPAQGSVAGVAAASKAVARALDQMLDRHDVVLLDLYGIMADRLANGGTKDVGAEADASLTAADAIIAAALTRVAGMDALLAVVCPESPAYPDPVKERSLGPVLLYQTKSPSQGLLYSNRTRWPGLITAADLAPAFLAWWQIGQAPGPLTIRPGTPFDLDRLDRTLTDHFRWSFVAVPVHMGLGAALILALFLALLLRPGWLPHLQLPALVAALVPVGFLLSHLAGTGSLWSFLLVGLLFTFAIAVIAARFPSAESALAVAMLAGAAVIAADTLTGNWLVRTAAYTPPPLIGARFYGLSNEHMGFLVGMATVGLAALWELRPGRSGLVIALAVVMVAMVSAPFWGANWGGGIAAAAALVCLWLLAVPHRWCRALPAAAVLMIAAATLPAMLDLLTAPTPQSRTHIGDAVSALIAGNGGSLADMARRKLHAGLHILTYTPWTSVLLLGTGAAYWLLLRSGGPARLPLRRRPRLTAGIAAATIGGVVSSLVNDSGVVAGAGLFAAALTTAIYLAARDAARHPMSAKDEVTPT
jgi:hypothetical protein